MMVEEAIVLSSQNGVDERPRHLLHCCRDALFVAEFRDQVSVNRVDSQRFLQANIPDDLDRRQFSVYDCQDNAASDGSKNRQQKRYPCDLFEETTQSTPFRVMGIERSSSRDSASGIAYQSLEFTGIRLEFV